MRVKVRFRFNAVTGEVEAFEVDDLHDGPRLADHDARHDRTAADVARIVEANALIEEIQPGTEPVTTTLTTAAAPPEAPAAEPERARE
jgi:FtsH ternary system domain X3